MAQAVTIYRHTDEGAPQIVEGRPSEYYDVFKKCLVEGFGTKAPLGWTITEEHTDSPFIAFQNDINNGGSGGYFTITAANNNPVRTMIGQSCLDFIDRDTMFRKGDFFPFNSAYGANETGYKVSSWMIFGTGTAFYCFFYPPARTNQNSLSGGKSATFFAGDFKSLYPNDSARFITLSGGSNQSSVNALYTLSNTMFSQNDRRKGVIFPLDGSNSNTVITLQSLFGTKFYSTKERTSSPDIVTLSEVYIFSGTEQLSSTNLSNNQINPFIRGILPGAFVSAQLGYHQHNLPYIKEIHGHQHWLFTPYDDITSALWINTEEWQ